MSRYPYHQELTVSGDPVQEPHAVTPGVAPTVYMDSMSSAPHLSINRSGMPLNLRRRCCRTAPVIVEAVQLEAAASHHQC